jgi:hypothetical protein
MLFAPARSLDAQSGISVFFFCCIVTAGFHISRLTWEIPWEFLGPMACDDPNMDGIIDQHFEHFSSALLSTFTQTSKHQKCWHANLADTVTTCYNMLQPTSICWLNPDVRTSEIYPILVGYVPFFCGKIMQHHVKSPCWYCIQLTSTFLPSPSHSSTPPMDGSTEWRPSRQWSRTPGIYKKAGVNDLPCYQVPLNMNIYILYLWYVLQHLHSLYTVCN